MMYHNLLAKIFSKLEQKKLRYGALVALFFVSLSLCALKPHLVPFQDLKLRLTIEIGADEKLQIVNDTSRSTVPTAADAEMIAKNPTIFNGTSGFQEVAKEATAEYLKTANDIITSNPSKVVKETIMEDTNMVNRTSSTKQTLKDVSVTKEKILPICNIMERSDFCEIKGDIRIDGNCFIVYVVLSEMDILATENTSWSIRPYARKYDKVAMSRATEWSVKLVTDQNSIPKCTQIHNVPSILFSEGGYAGNHFHAFTDVIVPLFATAQTFNEDVQFLITDRQPWWNAKFGTLMKGLSKYEVIDIDKNQDIHCFPSIIVGLKGHSKKELSIDPSKSAVSMKDFRQFLRSTYSLKRDSAIRIKDGEKKMPQLLIISRKRTRSFTNVDEITTMARKLGYNVVVAEPDSNVSTFAHIANSCDVMMGVHGAGLTNMVFLPDNAILIQVAPFGAPEWLTRVSFEEPAKGMNIRYLEYKIKVNESTLIEQYPIDHVALKDPRVILKKGWVPFKILYLNKQNVKLDVNSFRHTLLEALKLLHL